MSFDMTYHEQTVRHARDQVEKDGSRSTEKRVEGAWVGSAESGRASSLTSISKKNESLEDFFALTYKMPNSLQFVQIDASLFAQQLTFVAANLYGKVAASECVAWQAFSKHSTMPEQASNINAMIRQHDKTYRWALQTLIIPTEKKIQLQILHHLIAIADACRALNNFATLFSIISASTDKRAEQAVQSIDASARSKLIQLQALTSSAKGFIEFRKAIRFAALPCVPFFGLSTPHSQWLWLAHVMCDVGFTLTNLKFIEEGTPSFKRDGTPNESKYAKTKEVIAEIQRYQSETYDIEPRPDIQKLISDILEEAPVEP